MVSLENCTIQRRESPTLQSLTGNRRGRKPSSRKAVLLTQTRGKQHKEGRGRGWSERVYHVDSVDEKSWIAQERLNSEKRKRGRAAAIMKEVAGAGV
jgi:hypothetical protein